MTEQMKNRCDELHHLGLKFNGEYYQDKKSGVYVHHTDILCDKESDWKRTISEIKELRKRESDKPFTEEEKQLLLKAYDFYLNSVPKLNYQTLSSIGELRDNFTPTGYFDKSISFTALEHYLNSHEGLDFDVFSAFYDLKERLNTIL
jgi:hypothetical protein